MAVDTSVIGKQTGAWRVALDRAVLANFAKAVGDSSPCTSDDAAARGRLDAVPAPPTFTFACAVLGRVPADEQPADPTGAAATRCTRSWASCTRRARSCCTASRSSCTTARRSPATCSTACRRSPTSTRRRPTRATMTFVVMETVWTDADAERRTGRHRALQSHRPPARSRGRAVGRLAGQGRDHHRRRARASASRTRERFLAEGAKVVVAEVIEERAAGAMKALEGKGDVDLRADRHLRSPTPRSAASTRRSKAFGTVAHPREQRRALLRHRQLRPELRVPPEGVRR